MLFVGSGSYDGVRRPLQRRCFPSDLFWCFIVFCMFSSGWWRLRQRSSGFSGGSGFFQVRLGVVVVCFGVVVVLSSLPAPFSLFQEVVCAGDGFGRW
jgi:hypothetical protein